MSMFLLPRATRWAKSNTKSSTLHWLIYNGKKSKQYRFSCYSEFTNIIPTRLEHKQHLHTSLSDSLLQRCHSLMRPRTLFLQARQETSRRTLLCRGCRTNLCPLTSSYAAPLSSSSCAQQKYRHIRRVICWFPTYAQ